MIRTLSLTALLTLCFSHIAHADDMTTFFSTIEQNNPRLKALRQSNKASIAEGKAQNTIGETSVEYTPFFQKGADGIASSELIVAQEFDFPTLYSARNKSIGIQQDVLDIEYLMARRDVFIEAANCYYDLRAAIVNRRLLNDRLTTTDSLLSICNKRMKLGDATIMDQNRIRMDKMNILAELAQNEGVINRLRIDIERMGMPHLDTTQWTDTTMPAASIFTPTADMLEDEYIARTTAQDELALKIAKQEWLPRLTVGYRRNTELREFAFNGVLVGVSMPIFSNSKKVKAARMRKEATLLEMDNIRKEATSRLHTLTAEAQSLSSQLSAYDPALIDQTLHTLMRAVNAGQLTIIDYYTEADRVYSAQQNLLSVQSSYNKVITELTLRNCQPRGL